MRRLVHPRMRFRRDSPTRCGIGSATPNNMMIDVRCRRREYKPRNNLAQLMPTRRSDPRCPARSGANAGRRLGSSLDSGPSEARTPAVWRADNGHLMCYDFAQVHQTLRVTPAMEARISDHVWSVDEIVGAARLGKEKT